MVGCNSGRATPFLRRNRPSAIPNHQPRRNATYHSREAVQTTEASSQTWSRNKRDGNSQRENPIRRFAPPSPGSGRRVEGRMAVRRLDPLLVDRIAAGEEIEPPAAAVKEL